MCAWLSSLRTWCSNVTVLGITPKIEEALKASGVKPDVEPLTLDQWMSRCYKADVMHSGDYTGVSADFAAALAEDSVMKQTARDMVEELEDVLKARMGREHMSARKVKYLKDALGA